MKPLYRASRGVEFRVVFHTFMPRIRIFHAIALLVLLSVCGTAYVSMVVVGRERVTEKRALLALHAPEHLPVALVSPTQVSSRTSHILTPTH